MGTSVVILSSAGSHCLRSGSARAHRASIGLAIFKNCFFFVAKIGFFVDLSIKVTQIIFSQATILEETSHLIVNVLGDLGLVAVLELELIDEHALELLSFLNVHKSLTTLLTHS